MPDTILSSLLSAPALTVVSDTTGLNVAQALSVSKFTLKLRSRIFRHKREDGNTIVDARQVEPMKVELETFAPSLDAISTVNGAMMDRDGTYTVTSRGLVMRRMMVEAVDVKQSGDMISASPVKVGLKELLTQNQSNVGQQNVAQPGDSSLIDQGLQTISNAVTTVQNLASTVVANAESAAASVVQSAANTVGL
jgi:hypothetical protein